MVTSIGRITLAKLPVHRYHLYMTKEQLIQALAAAGWQGLDATWTVEELEGLYVDTILVARKAQDMEDR